MSLWFIFHVVVDLKRSHTDQMNHTSASVYLKMKELRGTCTESVYLFDTKTVDVTFPGVGGFVGETSNTARQ